MKTLYVLYDRDCGLCCRAVRRLIVEPTYVGLRFAPMSAPGIAERFGAAIGDGTQLVAVADSGEVYRGTSAWIMVLYALRRYRPLAMRLARPAWRPLAGRAIGVISRNRRGLSDMLGCRADDEVMRETRATACGTTPEANACPGGACERSLVTAADTTRLDELIRARQRVRAEWNAAETPAAIAPPVVRAWGRGAG